MRAVEKEKVGAYRGNATCLEEGVGVGGGANFLSCEPLRGLNPHLLAYIKGYQILRVSIAFATYLKFCLKKCWMV